MTTHVAALSLSLSAVLVGCSPEALDEPNDNLQHNFGVIVGNNRIKHEFRVPNRTARIWNVESTKVSCTCVRVLSCSKQVIPDEDFVLECEFDSFGVSGIIDRTITVEFRGASRHPLRFFVSAVVKGRPIVVPAALSLDATPRAGKFRGEARITLPAEDVSLEVRELTNLLDAKAQLHLSRTEGPTREFVLRIEGALGRRGVLSGGAQIEARYDGQTQKIWIPVTVRPATSFSVSPLAVLMKSRGEGATSTTQVYVCDENDPAGIQCHVEPADAAVIQRQSCEAGLVLRITIREGTSSCVIVVSRGTEIQRVPVGIVRS